MKIEYLKMIQGVISRMANNSLKLKGWTVAVLVSVLSFNRDSDSRMLLLSIIPVFSFWLYDAYYFMMERQYRMLYNDAINKNEKDLDYQMTLDNIPISIGDASKINYITAMFSKSTIWFYLACACTPVVILIINLINK